MPYDLWLDKIKSFRKCKQFSVIHNTYQPQKDKKFRLIPDRETVLTELWDWMRIMSLLPYEERKSASFICHLKGDIQGYIKEYICYIEQRSSNLPITEQGLFHWLLKAKRESFSQELRNRGIFPDVESIIRNKDIPIVQLWIAGMIVFIIKATPKAKDNIVTLTETVKICSSVIKTEEISNIANANILNHEMAEHLKNKPKKTLEKINLWKLRNAGINNETAVETIHVSKIDFGFLSIVETIICEDYRNDRLTTVTQAEKHRICLELLKTCIPVKDIDDRNRYKVNDIKTRLNSPESIQYLRNLVPKMAWVFDNTDAFCSTKKSDLKLDKAKLGLLNSALSAIYRIKFKTTNNKNTHYHLVGVFDNEDAPKLSPYQTGEGLFYESGKDIRYGYSKLSPNELKLPSNSISQNTQDLISVKMYIYPMRRLMIYLTKGIFVTLKNNTCRTEFMPGHKKYPINNTIFVTFKIKIYTIIHPHPLLFSAPFVSHTNFENKSSLRMKNNILYQNLFVFHRLPIRSTHT
ncbi:hypothetical protein Glove_101g13 [Diversispora epigaea]|uniref:Uncharacterized protein n=1 Tax=Diversispora epigaea TaxID=1348612 RepID=A0A397JCQ3_9GLOM|nr:hypothetical protein Glove_101g13 [Diversispora epigaea]